MLLIGRTASPVILLRHFRYERQPKHWHTYFRRIPLQPSAVYLFGWTRLRWVELFPRHFDLHFLM
jgi:hypothetical protein